MAGNRNSGMCSPLWHVCAFYLPPRSYIHVTFCLLFLINFQRFQTNFFHVVIMGYCL